MNPYDDHYRPSSADRFRPTKDPLPLSRALSELITLRGLARENADTQMAGIWKEVAGEKIAKNTRVNGIKRGILHIYVAHSALLNELVSFHKMALLDAIQKDHSQLKIRDIKFRLKADIVK